MKRALLVVLAVAFVGLVACGKNEAATAKCTGSADSDSCEKCCKTNGASGYSYASTCGCLGGS